MTDEKQSIILAHLEAGRKEALRELFDAYYLMVCQTIRRLVQDPGTVEDLAQEVFIRFWEKRNQIQVNSNLPAYLRRMAVNEALAFLRRQRYFEEESEIPADTGDNVEEAFLHTELEDSIRTAIDELPPRCRTVFQLSRFEELTYNEIADQMGISVKTVENQMGKALKHLRERLRTYLAPSLVGLLCGMIALWG